MRKVKNSEYLAASKSILLVSTGMKQNIALTGVKVRRIFYSICVRMCYRDYDLGGARTILLWEFSSFKFFDPF